MTAFMTHRNTQSREAGRFVHQARGRIAQRRDKERAVERLVFAMVVSLSGMACWTAADTLPVIAAEDGGRPAVIA